MDLPLRRNTRPDIDQEVPFSFEELFFSRTDLKGIIRSGNSVFQRISMYSWDELINRAHSIIRHPDMPRAVFWLLWDTIKKGEPIGAYVKNKAKDGRYYWVFAIVTPIEGGYLSVRLKPSSALFPIVDREYKSLAAATSRQSKISPEDAAAILLDRLAQLGFKSYGAFMSTALSKEMAARNERLGRAPDGMIACFDEIVTAADALLRQAGDIFAAYEKNEYVPLNLRVQVTRLGQSAATIGVISNNYDLIAGEIRSNMSRFMASAQQVHKTINDGLFLLCTAKVQQEVAEFFRTEASSGRQSHEQEMLYLEQQQNAYQQKAVDGLRAITAQAERFHQDCTEMKRLAASLEVTRVMGKMESSRLRVAKTDLDELIDDLEVFQTSVADGLREIDQMNHNIRHNAQRLLNIMDDRV
ncbi:MAG: PAS domain-containing protein [Bradyrhizobiaceae bacterium]|nr:PAS domain-containing protein [Bradyrhizobiaceae bacterium]